MKNQILLFSFLLLSAGQLIGQTIYFPQNDSNEPNITVTHIEMTTDWTMVYMAFIPPTDSEMFINSMMFIENAKRFAGKKLILKKFYCNGTEHYRDFLYSVSAGEVYELAFKFGPLPLDFEKIHIKEPSTTNKKYEPWHWKNIDLEDDVLKAVPTIIRYGSETELRDALRSLELLTLYLPNDPNLKASIAGVKLVLISQYGYRF